MSCTNPSPSQDVHTTSEETSRSRTPRRMMYSLSNTNTSPAMRYSLIALCGAMLLFAACKKDKDDPQPTPTPPPSDNTVTDADGNSYPTVTIGSQVWMAQNLRTTKYRDGSAIPNITSHTGWGALTTGAYANYDNDAGHAATYGRLYNWHAVNDTRGLCPQGWHVPSDAEWKTLETTLGMPAGQLNQTDMIRGGSQNVGGKLKSITNHWVQPNEGATNESGFTALPGGVRYADFDPDQDTSSFYELGESGAWWSSTASDANSAWGRHLLNYDAGVYRGTEYKEEGYCVRCLRD